MRARLALGLICLLAAWPLAVAAEHQAPALTLESVTPQAALGLQEEQIAPLTAALSQSDEPLVSRTPAQNLRAITVGGGSWAQCAPGGDLGRLNLSLEFAPGLTLARNLQSRAVSAQGAFMGTGIFEDVTDTLSMALTSRTQLALSRQLTSTRDLRDTVLSGTETRRVGLTQDFGAGASAGSVSLERAWITRLQGQTASELSTQSVALQSGLGGGYDLSARLGEEWDGDPFGIWSRSFETAVGLPLSGGRGSLAFSETAEQRGLQHRGSTAISLAAPLAMFGGTADLAHSQRSSYVDQARVREQLTSLATPLPGAIAFSGSLRSIDSSTPSAMQLRESTLEMEFPWFMQARGSFDIRQLSERQGGKERLVNLQNLMLPLGFLDPEGMFEYRVNEETKGALTLRDNFTRLATALPWAPEHAALLYTLRDTTTEKEGRQWERAFDFHTPVALLGSEGSVRWALHSTESDKAGDSADDLFEAIMPLTLVGLRGTASYIDRFTLDPKEGSFAENLLRYEAAHRLLGREGTFTYLTRATDSSKVGTFDEELWRLTSPITLLGREAGLSLLSRTSDSSAEGALAEQILNLHTPLHLLGQEGRLAYMHRLSDSERLGSGVEQEWTGFMPLAMLGGTGRLDLFQRDALIGTTPGRQSRLTLTAPLYDWFSGAQLVQRWEQRMVGGPTTTVLASDLTAPWQVLGTSGRLRQQYITTETDSSLQSRLVTNLQADVNHKPLTLDRDYILTHREEGRTDRREMLALATPLLHLFTPRATFTGQRVQITDTAGKDEAKTTLDVTAKPLERFTLAARLEAVEEEHGVDTATQHVLSSLDVTDAIRVQGRMESTERSDQPAGTSLRQVQLSAENGLLGGLSLLMAHTAWGYPTQQGIAGDDVRLTLGNPNRGLSVVARRTDYDPEKLEPYRDPLVNIAVRHAVPSGLSIRLGYEDQEGRPAPEQTLALQLPTGGGALKLGYAENPLDVLGQTVLLARRYDADLQQRILGSVDLQFAYRQYDFDSDLSPLGSSEFFRLSLAGGSEDRGGQIRLGYMEGDFVPRPDPKKTVPASVLDLSYSRRWSADGRFMLTLQRTSPTGGHKSVTENMEGRLEFNTSF